MAGEPAGGRFRGMSAVGAKLLAGLPDLPRRLLAEPPVMEKRLIELSVAWPGLTGGRARMAEAVRLFAITWDPLAGIVERLGGFATTNGGSADLEIVVYLPTWSLVRMATGRDSTLSAVMGVMAGSAVATAADHADTVDAARYPELAARGEVPDLLSDPSAGSALGAAEIIAVSDGWEPIGLGAITDLAQHAFGPVDLDRSPVELATTTAVRWGCPACAGGRFGFPGALAEAKAAMCPAHLREAESVTARRLARANASNPDGWAAITDASQALDAPHLPNGLVANLPRADSSIYLIPTPGELAERAAAVVEAAQWFRGRPADFAVALGQGPELAGQWPDWLANLVLDLGAAGLGSEAERVGDALAEVDPDRQATLGADIAVALAESGLADRARDRIAANLARWPHDLWTRVNAGDALAALGDYEGARGHFDTARQMTQESDDVDAAAEVSRRLRRDAQRAAGKPSRGGQREQPRKKPSKAERKRGRRGR